MQPLKCYELFQSISPALADQIFEHLIEAEKEGYKAVLANLAEKNRLRPQFVQRKPRAERHRWLQSALGKKLADDVAGNVLQVWLLGAKASMLCEFLDALGIPHDERGMIDDLPPAPEEAKLREAIDAVLAKYPREEVAVYLHAFHAMDQEPWPSLTAILTSDDRLDPKPR
jgi:hypothetical protein